MIKKTIKTAALTMALTGSSLFAGAFIGDDFHDGNSYNTKSPGSLDWVSPWNEFGDSDRIPFTDPTKGTILINFNTFDLRFGGSSYTGTLKATTSIVRALDLENTTNVTLTLKVVSNDYTGNRLKLQLWNNVESKWVDQTPLIYTPGTVSVAITDKKLLTADSKIRFISASGDWVADKFLVIDDIKVAFDYTDTDGDNVADNLDKDDDNDGILDIDEQNSQVAGIDITTAWTQNGTNAMRGTLGNQVVDLIDQGDIFDDFGNPPSAALNPYSKTFWSSDTRDSLQAAPSNALTMNTYSPKPQTGDMAINLPKDTKRVLIHVDRLGANSSGTSESARFTLNNATNFVMTMGDSNGNLQVDSINKYFERITGVGGQTHTDSHPGTNGSTDGSAAGTIIIESNTAFNSLSFNVSYIDKTGNLTRGEDGLFMIIETETTISGSKDSDHDGISDEFDLDSDNDGIPDSIEAQATPMTGLIYIAGGTNVDANGIPNEVSGGFTTPLPDKDGDGTPDFLDSDSDNDDIPDCNEGNTYVKDHCPIITVELDGMSVLAGSNGSYGNILGNVINTETVLFGYISSLNEVAYRIPRVCGNNTWELKDMQWKTISVPCKITEGIDAIFGAQLGAYGDSGDWVMYEQSSSFTGSPASDFQQPMASGDTMIPGKGYWIISTAEHNVSIDEGSLSITKTSRALQTNHSSTSPNFTEVHQYTGLPDSSSTEQKVLLGNPFPVSFHLGDLFVSNDDGTNFYPLYDTAHTSFTSKIVYTYDATGRDPNNYVAKTATGTPGFGDVINPGIGFWYRLVPGNPGKNRVDYPYSK